MNESFVFLVERVESTYGIDSSYSSLIMTYGEEWAVTARQGTSVLTWTGKGECPWRVNQRVRVTVSDALEGGQ